MIDLRDHLTDAHDSMLCLAERFCSSDDPKIVGLGEGLALGAVEIRRILSLRTDVGATHEGPPPWGRVIDVTESATGFSVELLGWHCTRMASYDTLAEAEYHAAAVRPHLPK
jgi:hypothetical protein